MLAFATRRKAIRLLQANLNHARRAQDLFVHTLAKRDCGLGVIAEPCRVPVENPCWAIDPTGLAAIIWRDTPTSLPCSFRGAGLGYVSVDWGPISVIGGYIFPNVPMINFETWLDGDRGLHS